MKFKSNTKPLQDALDLVVVPSNISQFYAKSTLLQISVDSSGSLQLNSQADSVKSEAKIKGAITGDIDTRLAFLNAVTFKQLISTLDSATIELDFMDGSVVVYSGRSKFIVPHVDFGADVELDRPVEPSGEECDLKSDVWKMVKSKQMYALSDNFVRLVYTYIFNGIDCIMVGDYTSGLFTRIEKTGLPSQCLLSSNVVSLILGVDTSSKLYHVDRSFVVVNNTDAYQFVAELEPKYETNPEVGSYSADIIGSLFTVASKDGIQLPTAKTIKTLLSQTNLLSEGDNPSIRWTCTGNKLHIKSDNVDGDVECKLIGAPADWDIEFNLKAIISVISNLSGEFVAVYPSFRDDECNALVFKDEDVSVILSGVDDN